MAAYGYQLFDTAIGRCGIVWSEHGIAGVQLPEKDARATGARVQVRFPEAREASLPSGVQLAADGIVALLRGERFDLGAIALDMRGVPAFHRRVYEVAREISPGATLTYGEIAKRLAAPGSARAVGQALGRNPFAIVVPCHRVISAGGRPGGFSANGGAAMKLRLLALEGVKLQESVPLLRAEQPLDFDSSQAIEHVRASDAALGRVIDAVGPFCMERKTTASVFVALAEAIVYQQLSGKAAATIFSRVCALFPGSRNRLTPERILSASDANLRGAGLSRAKLLALRDLAARAKTRALPSLAALREMDDAAIIDCLTEVRGIGRWTAQMFLMFRLGRPDVLPADDYGIRKGFSIAFKQRVLPTPEAVLRRGERWKPYRTLASWYLWRAVELGPNQPRV